MKLWERVSEARMRREIHICEQKFGFMPGRSTVDVISSLRVLFAGEVERGPDALLCVFIDLGKAYDQVLRGELWECLRLAGSLKCYVRVIKDVYDRAKTAVRSAAGLTEQFEVGVGLHQGSALRPFLLAIIMDKLRKDISEEAPWDMLFADDIVLSREERRKPEEALERWRNAPEKRGLKICRTRTEYLKAG